MYVYLKKDLERIGLAGQLIKVKKGFAENFLIPQGYAVQVNEKELSAYEAKSKKADVEKAALTSKAAMLSEKIRNMHVTIKEKVHDDNKLYGAVGPDEIVEALRAKDIIINRKQVEVGKSIKTLGEHKVIIKMSSKLKSELTVKVVQA